MSESEYICEIELSPGDWKPYYASKEINRAECAILKGKPMDYEGWKNPIYLVNIPTSNRRMIVWENGEAKVLMNKKPGVLEKIKGVFSFTYMEMPPKINGAGKKASSREEKPLP